jgi:hypothetical protein
LADTLFIILANDLGAIAPIRMEFRYKFFVFTDLLRGDILAEKGDVSIWVMERQEIQQELNWLE